MSTATAVETATWKVEHSWEATTLDYLSPHWYETQAGFATEAEAEAFRAQKQAERNEAGGEPLAYRVRRVPSAAERQQWADEDAAANRMFWEGRAREARRMEEARRSLFALKGKTVTVTRGRKVPQGTTGEVFWVGEDRFNEGSYRVGLKTPEGEKVFVAAHYVEEV